MIDLLAAEYHWPPDVLLSLPVARALCHHAAILERHEVKTGRPTFAEMDLLGPPVNQ
jgi:hypothetical protein